jgi:hypothetical protein
VIDLRVINTKTILPQHSVAPIRGFLPPSVIVLGDRMSLAQEVEYNGILVDEFVVADPTRLIVRIPQSQVGRPLDSLRVFSSVSLAKQDATVTFGLTSPTKMLEGIDRLVQSFLMIFLSTPGSDIFSPDGGGGVLSLVGRSTNNGQNSIAADISLAIGSTKQEMLAQQSKTSGIPMSERLLSCDLDSVSFRGDPTSVAIQVSISNMTGDSAQVSFGG